VVLGAFGTMVVSRHLKSQVNGNESRAVATLKNIGSAQSQLQASGSIDPDGDQEGAFGFFGELAGAVSLPAGHPLEPPVLGLPFAAVGDFAGNGQGAVVVQGYIFQIWLPAKGGGWVAGDLRGGRLPDTVDEELAERHWMCFAWPLEHGWTGRRAFYLDSHGDIVAMRNLDGRYSGVRGPTAGRAALRAPVDPSEVGAVCLIAANTVDAEGDLWVVV